MAKPTRTESRPGTNNSKLISPHPGLMVRIRVPKWCNSTTITSLTTKIWTDRVSKSWVECNNSKMNEKFCLKVQKALLKVLVARNHQKRQYSGCDKQTNSDIKNLSIKTSISFILLISSVVGQVCDLLVWWPLGVIFFPRLLFLWLLEWAGEYDPNVNLSLVREIQSHKVDFWWLCAQKNLVDVLIFKLAVCDVKLRSGRNQLSVVKILPA